MRLDGGEKKQNVMNDIEEGVLIAYLINKEDTNINKPLGRVLIKPFIHIDSKDLVLFRDNTYGTTTKGFEETVDDWLKTNFGEPKGGYYKLQKKLYQETCKIFMPYDNIENTLNEFGIKNYTINEDSSVDVNGDVNLGDNGLRKLPIVFGNVSGSFFCSSNKLKSLEGAPQSVGGYFDCSYNQLTSLEGCPKSVGRGFICSNNAIKFTKDDLPSYVELGEEFYG
jgi:hypothetical protein